MASWSESDEPVIYDGIAPDEDDSLYWLLHPRVAEVGWYVFLLVVGVLVAGIVVRWVLAR
jgi:hypothetical protein